MSYTRRNLIKGISLGAGYSVLSPVLGQLKQHAEGNSAQLPQRFVFVVKSSGIIPETVIPPKARRKAPEQGSSHQHFSEGSASRAVHETPRVTQGVPLHHPGNLRKNVRSGTQLKSRFAGRLVFLR